MIEQENNDAQSLRLLKSARILRAYFEQKLQTSLELLTEAPIEPLKEGMQFDLHLNRFGIWGIRSHTPLSEKSQSEIAASFHGLLGAMNELESRRHELVDLEARILASVSEIPSNVIPIRRGLNIRPKPFQAVRDRRWILRIDCLIESERAQDIHKMAMELHSHSHRFAFLEYAALSRNCRLNLSELKQLGSVSLFIPNILDLSLEEQTVLAALVRENSLQRPLLMVGAPVAYSELRGEPQIHLEFLALLSRAYIKLTRPFAEYKDQGLIHYFLDSLSQNPT